MLKCSFFKEILINFKKGADKIMKYYTCANTSEGFTDLTEDNIFDIETKIELKGSSSHIRNLVLKLALEYNGSECEEIICPGTSDLLSGVILRDKGIAIVNKCVEANKVINLDSYFGVPEYNPRTKYLYECMFSSFAEAKKIHDAWEAIYGRNMDFTRLNKYGEDVINKLVRDRSVSGSGKIYKRFFGTSTADGPSNFIDNITEKLEKRYFIKGRPGTGKSTFLKKLLARLVESGYDAEVYLCSFDRNSLDMVLSRELSFCVFDSTAPHEKFPAKETDEILDFYTNSGLAGVDEKYERELFNIKSSYDMKVKEGMSFFKIARELRDASDRQAVSKVKDDDLAEIIREMFKA